MIPRMNPVTSEQAGAGPSRFILGTAASMRGLARSQGIGIKTAQQFQVTDGAYSYLRAFGATIVPAADL